MSDLTPHPEFWAVWSSSPWPEDAGRHHRIGLYRSRLDAEKATAQWPDKDCRIVEPS